MHEVALVESILAAIEERVRAAQVQRVRLQVGQLAGVLPEALRFSFDVCSCGSAELEVLAGEELRIQNVEVQ